jgi:hypothetical protein
MNASDFFDPVKLEDGKIIGTDVPTEIYLRQDPAIKRGDPNFVMSRSELMLFDSNPQRWYRGYVFKDTDATEWGTLMDALFTCPSGRFDGNFAVQPETVTATKTMSIVKEGEARDGDLVPWQPLCKEAKEWTKEARKAGKQIVRRADYEDARQALKILKEDAWIGALTADAQYQVMCIATYVDRETKIAVPLKCLIDIVPSIKGQFSNSLADFKTARNASPDEWQKVIDRQNYDAQAAMSIDIYTASRPQERWVFHHVIQENEFPFQQARRTVGDNFVAIGRIKYVMALKRYCQCLKENAWPSWDDAGPGVVNGFGTTSPTEWTLTKYGLIR